MQLSADLIAQSEDTTDTSASVLGKQDRSMVEQSALKPTPQQVEGKRSRGDVPAFTMGVGLAVAQADAQ